MDLFKRGGASTAGIGLMTNTRTGDPWAKQPKYTQGTVATLSILILLAAALSARRRWQRFRMQQIRDGDACAFPAKNPHSQLGRMTAAFRLLAYRELPSYRMGFINFRLPALGATLTMCALMLGFTIWVFVVQPYYRDDRSFGSPPLALRSGMMALGLMPFIYVLGSKVNFISIITGTSHERLQVYHQWMARFMLFLSTVHAIPFIHQPLADHGVAGLRDEFYSDSINTTGVIAYACLFVLSFASATGIRERCYELFLLIHVPVAILFLGYMFVHCQGLLTSWRYLWATAAMYMLSVFLRLAGQLSRNNFLVLTRCHIEALPEGVTRLTIQSPIRWKPGQHVFIRFPGVAPWSAHPFTIVSMPAAEKQQLLSTVVVMAKARDGLTKHLYEIAVKAQGGVISSRLDDASKSLASLYAIVDGPYGQDAGISNYDRALLVAGGSGITFVLASVLDLAWLWQRGQAMTKKVHLVWSVREPESLSWVRHHLEVIEAIAPAGAFRVSIYISGKEHSDTELSLPTSWDVQKTIHPDVSALVLELANGIDPIASSSSSLSQSSDEEKAAGAASVDGGASSESRQSAAVVVCGPGGMAKDASNAVAHLQTDIIRGQLPHLEEVCLIKEHFGF